MKRFIPCAITTLLLGTNCFAVPTNERTACHYKLKNNIGSLGNDSCMISVGQILTYNDPSSTPEQREEALGFFNLFFPDCVEYRNEYEKCNKEINNYIPTLHPQ
ncbi:hypothetical protein [Leptospira saintgironsiae]|uniref:Lipoprotein n=1 Tax=Leptospira saintgironsiae TaxID=2023183 RepID=A0A2M9Y9C7_9LEPT|nr:hypothetical protein [Leptospira saintgironsiae]PJZ48033.1 hypothetical protein CH362_16050 [Leptospira saintgironsiae]